MNYRIYLLAFFLVGTWFSPSIVMVSAATTTASSSAGWFVTEKIEGVVDSGDFIVGPGRTEIQIMPGQKVIKEITVTNRISDNRLFRLEVDDIVGSKDGSSAVSLTDGARGPYSIRDYLSFPDITFKLNLGERARIPVTISIPANAEPGGFYGSVLVSTERAPEDNIESSRSPVIARIGSLFFLTVGGDVKRSGVVKGIEPLGNKHWFNQGPITFGILYENTGSVHVNPYGELRIRNIFGEEVGFVELEPWFVLPKSLRNREITWSREFLLGRYTATAYINRGYDDVIDEVRTSFWVVPWIWLAGGFLSLFILIFLLRLFFRNFEFTRKRR
jgi:hypothetical protein